jgi:hypothetical protein
MWFCVSALSVSEHPDGSVASSNRLWVISAEDAVDAKAKAELLARREQCTYNNSDGAKVSWEFKAISTVYQLENAPTDGSEVFSRFLKDSEAQSLLVPFP